MFKGAIIVSTGKGRAAIDIAANGESLEEATSFSYIKRIITDGDRKENMKVQRYI